MKDFQSSTGREELRQLADEMQGLGYMQFGDCLSLKAYNLILTALRSDGVAQAEPSPDIFAIHQALKMANLEYAAFSCNGFNLVGDAKSIKEAVSAFHSHAQIDQFRTQIRHWREECGKLHAKLASAPQPDSNAYGWRDIGTAPKDGTGILVCDATKMDSQKLVYWDEDAVPNDIGLFAWAVEDMDGRYHEKAFTHWMPTPSIPSTDRCTCHPYIASQYGHDKSCPLSSSDRSTP